MSSSPPSSPWKLVEFKDGPNGTNLDQFRGLLEHAYKDDPVQIIINLNRASDTPPAAPTGTKMTNVTDFLFEQFHLRRAHELVFFCDPRAANPRETNRIWGEDPPGQPYVIGQFLCPKTGLPLNALENLVIMFGTFAHTGRINNFFRHCSSLKFMTVWSNATPASTRRLPIPSITATVNPLVFGKLVHADLTLSFAHCLDEMYLRTPNLIHLRIVMDDPNSSPETAIISFARSVRVAKLAGAFSDAHLDVFIRNHPTVEGIVLDYCPVGTKFVDIITRNTSPSGPIAPNMAHLSIGNGAVSNEDVLKICRYRRELNICLIDCPNTDASLMKEHDANGQVTWHGTSESFWAARDASGNPDYPLPMMDEGLQRELYMTEPDL